MRDVAAANRVVGGVVQRFGRLDVLVNNVAGNFPAPITDISPNGFKAVVDIDLLGTYNVSKAAFDAWLREHGEHRQHHRRLLTCAAWRCRPTWPRPRRGSTR